MDRQNKTFTKRIIGKILGHFNLCLYDKSVEEIAFSFINDYGYQKTRLVQKPISTDYEPLPWFTYPAIEYLNQLDLREKTIFEWGSGNSSLFFARRCKQVISVESDQEWYEYSLKNALPNQQILFEEEAKFADSIEALSLRFDVIIIDSLRRYECASKAIDFLEPGGLIILDNSDWHPQTSAFLREHGDLIEVDMHGFGPINPYSWTTSFYFHREFRFSPKNGTQPSYSKAAIQQISNHDK